MCLVNTTLTPHAAFVAPEDDRGGRLKPTGPSSWYVVFRGQPTANCGLLLIVVDATTSTYHNNMVCHQAARRRRRRRTTDDAAAAGEPKTIAVLLASCGADNHDHPAALPRIVQYRPTTSSS